MERLGNYRVAAELLSRHPHDHGWRELYRLFALSLGDLDASPTIARLIEEHQAADPDGSATHAITLLGIAMKSSLPSEDFAALLDGTGTAGLVEILASSRWEEIRGLITGRRNSFTGARRFLVAQVLISAFFSRSKQACRLVDVGTGLGILPRQINSRESFDRFSSGLRWQSGQPTFVSIELTHRFGIDRPPLPDADWVENCYGSSEYYRSLYQELRDAFSILDVARAPVVFEAIDVVAERHRFREMLRANAVNAANLSYFLYELAPPIRAQVLSDVVESVSSPSIVVVTEPRGDLTRGGCDVNVFLDGSPQPLEVCTVTDGHFMGDVLPGRDYTTFASYYPIESS